MIGETELFSEEAAEEIEKGRKRNRRLTEGEVPKRHRPSLGENKHACTARPEEYRYWSVLVSKQRAKVEKEEDEERRDVNARK